MLIERKHINKDWILKQFQQEHLIYVVEQNTKASSNKINHSYYCKPTRKLKTSILKIYSK